MLYFYLPGAHNPCVHNNDFVNQKRKGMCYYIAQNVTKDVAIRLQQLEKETARYDFLDNDLQIGFDYGAVAVLKKVPNKTDFDIVPMEWGFIPHYLKTKADVLQMRNGYYDNNHNYRPPMITLNAVAEELLAPGKIYRDAALHRRCLVLCSGFYEWRHIHPLNKRTGQPVKKAITYPYFIHLRDRNYFFMAGIWQPWTDKETGEYLETFAIVTTKANSLMEQIHNTKKRMPVVLPDELAYEWLIDDLDEARILEIAATAYPAAQMAATPIARDFRQSPEPAKPFEYEDLPQLEAVC